MPDVLSLIRFSCRILLRRPAICIKSSAVACFIFGLRLPNVNLAQTSPQVEVAGYREDAIYHCAKSCALQVCESLLNRLLVGCLSRHHSGIVPATMPAPKSGAPLRGE